MNEDRPRIFCLSVGDENQGLVETLVPSVTVPCGDCGTQLLVSQTMAPQVESGAMVPICEHCLLTVEEVPNYHIHPNQRDELRNLGLLELSERFVNEMNEANREGK